MSRISASQQLETVAGLHRSEVREVARQTVQRRQPSRLDQKLHRDLRLEVMYEPCRSSSLGVRAVRRAQRRSGDEVVVPVLRHAASSRANQELVFAALRRRGEHGPFPWSEHRHHPRRRAAYRHLYARPVACDVPSSQVGDFARCQAGAQAESEERRSVWPLVLRLDCYPSTQPILLALGHVRALRISGAEANGNLFAWDEHFSHPPEHRSPIRPRGLLQLGHPCEREGLDDRFCEQRFALKHEPFAARPFDELRRCVQELLSGIAGRTA